MHIENVRYAKRQFMKTKTHTNIEKLLLNKDEVAHLIGCSWRHVQNLTHSGILPYVKLGRLIRYRKQDIEQAIEGMVCRAE
jgi:excisionase family DNA binding protein